MTATSELSPAEFAACFAEPMVDVTDDEDGEVDIWDYVDALDPATWGLDSFDDVERVYQDANGRYDQILIATDEPNKFLVIVVDIASQSILGHRLLDLDVEYGLIPDAD